jgi:hypothetical protein
MHESFGSKTGVAHGSVYLQLARNNPSIYCRNKSKRDVNDVQIADSRLYPDPAPNV